MATRGIKIGNVNIGGGSRIAIQSMSDLLTTRVSAVVAQIKRLEVLGCDIMRLAIPDKASVVALKKIKAKVKIPLVADIHYDYRLALASIAAGADKIRINPGNIGGLEKLKIVLDAAKKNKVVVRIGVNAGSLRAELVKRHGGPTAEALVESAKEAVSFCEAEHFFDLVLSLKSSSVKETIAAYRLAAQKLDFPLHLGLTEAGPLISGLAKSALALGTLLQEGIGDTIRVSLTEKPETEVLAAKEILKAAGYDRGPEIISCPTCARTALPVKKIASELEVIFQKDPRPFKIAVMGCLVNGPGEAKEADLGVCGIKRGQKEVMIFKKGKLLGKIKKSEIGKKIKLMLANYGRH